jgi:hypothetical protein
VSVGDIVRIREDRGSKVGFHVGWYDSDLHVILAVEQRPWGKLVFLHPRVSTVDGWPWGTVGASSLVSAPPSRPPSYAWGWPVGYEGW